MLMKSICFHSRSTVPHSSQTFTWPLIAGWVTIFSLVSKKEWESHANENRTEGNILLPSSRQLVPYSLGGMGSESVITAAFQLP